jgi:hypothetical protein
LVFAVCTGTKFSVWVPGAGTTRRPLSSISVLPVPRLRRLTDDVSPRASLRLPVVRASWNCTSPACGIDRKRSSPDTAAVAMMSSFDHRDRQHLGDLGSPDLRTDDHHLGELFLGSRRRRRRWLLQRPHQAANAQRAEQHRDALPDAWRVECEACLKCDLVA